MPLCVNRTFFTAWFLTSATASGVNPLLPQLYAAHLHQTSCREKQKGRSKLHRLVFMHISVLFCTLRDGTEMFLHSIFIQQLLLKKKKKPYAGVLQHPFFFLTL